MSRSSRRTQAQWQHLVQQWQESNLSAGEFCKKHSVGYVSFCKWRNRLSSAPNTERKQSSNPSFVAPSAFVDLGSIAKSTQGWCITLSSGEGIELRLAQG